MTDTANLGLPFIDGSQAQKHVTHNEALRILDAVIQIGVLDVTRTTPPSTPVEGDRHVVATGASGAWTGQASKIATYEDATWRFLIPKLGWSVWCAADEVLFVFDGATWRDLRDLPVSLDTVSHLGINATATSPNLLNVKSNAALFNSINVADGGSGDARIQISKESSAKTASVVFSDAFSGRAEFGLVGSDAFKLKVSNDGSTFVESLVIDQTTGNLTLPRGVLLTGVLSPSQITSNQNDYAPSNFATANVMRISTDALRNITGLAGGAEGRTIYVVNAGSNPAVLKDENASSTAANRFGFGSDLTLAAKQGATLIYDGNASRWRQIGGPSSSSGGSYPDVNRQNALLSAIYQAKLFGQYRRAVLEFYDGFMDASGINSGSSSNYNRISTSPAVSYVAPSTSGSTTGSFGNASAGSRTVNSSLGQNAGFSFVAPASSAVLTVRVPIAAVAVAGTWEARLYTNSGSSPGTQVGSSSGAVSISAISASVTFTFSSPPSITNGTTYWIVITPATGSPDMDIGTASAAAGYTSGRNNTIASITNGLPSLEIWRVEIAYGAGSNNMTLVSTLQTADSTVSNARILIEYDNTATPTLNTDLTVEVTCNGGSNWTSASLSAVTSYSQGGRKVAESVDQACTSGTSFAARIKTLNNKNVPVYGVSVTAR